MNPPRKRHRIRRAYRKVRAQLGSLGRTAFKATLVGLGTYGGLRSASPAFRFISRRRWARRYVPTIAAATRRMARKGVAAEWGLATGALGAATQIKDEIKGGLRKRYRRWAGIR